MATFSKPEAQRLLDLPATGRVAGEKLSGGLEVAGIALPSLLATVCGRTVPLQKASVGALRLLSKRGPRAALASKPPTGQEIRVTTFQDESSIFWSCPGQEIGRQNDWACRAND